MFGLTHYTTGSVRVDEIQLEENAIKNDKDENSVQSSLDSLEPEVSEKGMPSIKDQIYNILLSYLSS